MILTYILGYPRKLLLPTVALWASFAMASWLHFPALHIMCTHCYLCQFHYCLLLLQSTKTANRPTQFLVIKPNWPSSCFDLQSRIKKEKQAETNKFLVISWAGAKTSLAQFVVSDGCVCVCVSIGCKWPKRRTSVQVKVQFQIERVSEGGGEKQTETGRSYAKWKTKRSP